MNLASCGLKIILLACSTTAMAKDLSGRLGAGISNLGSSTLEAASIDWQPTRATGFEFNLGLNSSEADGGWSFGIRASRNLFIEEHMIFSLFVGGSVLQEKTSSTTTATGYLVETGIGSKFFIQGLPNLGFGFRGALQIEDVTGFKLKIAPAMSVHYYF